MIVMAKTATGYMVEMTEREITHAAGFSSERLIHKAHPKAMEEYQSSHYVSSDYRFKIGAVVPVSPMFRYITELRDHEQKVKDSASLLRAMAEMMVAALPEQIVPPETTSEGPA